MVGAVSLIVTLCLIARKKTSAYGSIALGLAVFIGLFLLDALALNRLGIRHPHATGIDLGKEWQRLLHPDEELRMVMLFNLAAFVPFGFFLSEFISATRRLGWKRRLGIVALSSGALSLGIELFQLAFRVGMFEVSDWVLNTAGGMLGFFVALAFRGCRNREKKS